MIEVNFILSAGGLNINKRVNENNKVKTILDQIIEENKLNDIKINFLLCDGKTVNIMESFKNNIIKDKYAIMIISGHADLDDSTVTESEPPLRFEVVKCITKHSHVNLENADLNAFIDSTFTVFKSLKNEYLLIHSYSEDYKHYSLFCYDILKEKNVRGFHNAHDERIFTCSHFLDDTNKMNKRDLLITGAFDKKIKIWNISNNFQIIYEIKPDYIYKENTYLLSENLLSYKNKIYLIASAYEINSNGYPMLYYGLSGDKSGIFENSKDNTNFLGIYYNNGNSYIIAANCGNIKLYNFSTKKLINKYSDNDNNLNYLSAIIDEYKTKLCLMVSSADGFLRIWDVNNSKNLLNKITIYEKDWLIGLEKINEQYILAACSDGSIKEFDLYKDYVACSLERQLYNDPLFTLKYININGEDYLFSHSHKGIIELWK
jgi:WD40 repeat protein